MSTSITVYPVTGPEIHLLKDDLTSVHTLFAGMRNGDKGYLDGYWRALHGLLTQDGKILTLPEVAVNSGDLSLPQIESGAHVIFAPMNIRFSALLSLFTEQQTREYVSKHQRAFKALHPDAVLEEFEQEFWYFFLRLRETSYKARDAGCGLIFIKWEE